MEIKSPRNEGFDPPVGVLSDEKSRELDLIQEEVAQAVFDYLNECSDDSLSPLIAMATGIGKGRIIHKIIERTILEKPDSRILVIAGTKIVLVDQTQEALSKYTNESQETQEGEYEELEGPEADIDEVELVELMVGSLRYATTSYSSKDKSEANVHVATIQRITTDAQNGRLNPDEYDLLIVDEVHNIGTEKRVSAIAGFKRKVGFTATPHRHSGKLLSPEDYGFSIIRSLSLPEAQEREFLPPIVQRSIDTAGLVDCIPVTTTGKIDYRSLEKLLKQSPDLIPYIAENIMEYLNINGDPQKAVIAVNYVWEAQELAQKLRTQGVRVGIAVNNKAAKEIHSDEIPALDAIERYKLDKTDPNCVHVLVSPYVASEGFDAPDTSILVWASPTDSTIRYTQFTGRVTRRFPGKTHGLVLDFLYQTSQFKWSYNFGQWMKDSVIQLDDGSLFQGSKKQLDTLLNDQNFQRIAGMPTSGHSLVDLQEGTELLPLEEGDFPLTYESLTASFIGDRDRLMQLAHDTLQNLLEEGQQITVLRKNFSHVVSVITDLELFKARMLANGAVERQQLVELQDEDFVVSYANITATFNNISSKTRPVLDEVLAELADSIQLRRGKSFSIVRVIDYNTLREKLLQYGFTEKEKVPELKEGEIAITQKSLRQIFIGGYTAYDKIAREVLSEMSEANPDLIVQRSNGGRAITAVTNPDEFIRRMTEKGVRIKLGVPELHETELSLSYDNLAIRYKGAGEKIKKVAQEVIRQLIEINPESVVQRIYGGKVINAVVDTQAFDVMMEERGIKLAIDIAPVQDHELVIGQNTLISLFRGAYGTKLKPMAEEVLEELRRDRPEIVAARKSGHQIVEVVTDPEAFKVRMLEKGAQFKINLEPVKDGEFVIGQSQLASHFKGSQNKIRTIADKIVTELRTSNPSLVVQRTSGPHAVIAITDFDLFAQKMRENGIELK